METVAVGTSFDTAASRATQDASFDALRTQRVRLGLDVNVSAGRGYRVTLIRAANTLHGWGFPPEVLRAAVPHFEGASCFVDPVGWFQEAASLGDLVGMISQAPWSETKSGLTGRLRLSNTPAGGWMQALIERA
jgi:hypothetical protein